MQLSVIIVTYNSARHLPVCLESLGEHLRNVEYEVCVVDNASDDGTVALARAAGGRTRVVRNDRNLGFSAAVNTGLRSTSGRYCMWLNPDAMIVGGDVSELLRHFEEEPEVGIIGPQVLNADGSVQLSCRSFPSYNTAFFNRYSLLTRLFPTNRYSRTYLHTDWDHRKLREVDWVSGACLLHRRALLDDVGGLDEQFFMYIEDIDFCLRASRAGWKVHYHPALRVLHHIAGSSRQVPFSMIVELHKSIWRYYAKHFRRDPLKDAVGGAVIWGRCAGMLARAALRQVTFRDAGGLRFSSSSGAAARQKAEAVRASRETPS
ncbi:MAG: glycosyltransferase family 2 protein [Acidobacteria bacterium]|nr:glycosyltransferase family 2 protein [Acidobacteriota bacterium]